MNNNKKVFLLVASYAFSITNFRLELLKRLVEQGFEVHVTAPDILTNQGVLSKLKPLGVVIHEYDLQRTGLNPLRDLQSLWQLNQLMRTIKADYMLAYTIKPVVYGLLAARLAGVSQRFALITGLGFAAAGDSALSVFSVKKLARYLYRLALKQAQVIFFQNADDRAHFLAQNVINSAQQTVVVNGSGVDLTLFAEQPLPESLSFLLIARLLVDKGIREYAQAARRLKQQYPHVSVGLVGWIDDENSSAISQSELQTWINDGVIEFFGRLDDVRPALEQSSVFVLPSAYPEGVPRTILEALAVGRAIITTDTAGCRETVVQGENGFLVPVRDSESLYQAMLHFIQQPEDVSRMGSLSRRLAEQKFDVHKVNQAMLKGMGILPNADESANT